MSESPLLIVGLGNPGREHEENRHNVGWMVLDELCGKAGGAFSRKLSGQIGRIVLEGRTAVLLKPETYMNDSGRSVEQTAAFFRIAPSDILVVHDELDLPFGEVRIKVGGGHAGHNGLRSILECLGGAEFMRVRVGIGRPPDAFGKETVDWVLSCFDAVERAALGDVIAKAVDATLRIVREGVDRAMNEINVRPKPAQGGGAPPTGPEGVSASSGTTEIGARSAWC